MKTLRRDGAVVSALLMLSLGVVLLAGAPPALAQQMVTSAALGGRVEDANGAALPDVTVTATDTETNQSKVSTTDDDGRYRFSYLPVGAYELKAERPGFATLTKSLTLTVGHVLDVPLSLSVAGVAEDVQVSGSDTAVVEKARTQLAETVLPKDVEGLPLNGRNFLDLALLLPGVSRTNTGSVQRFAETSAVPGTGISVAGQRNLANSFIVDGSSANDDSVELAGTYYSQEVIREFQVVTSGAVAEFGRASGGFVDKHSEANRELFIAVSGDGGRTFSKNLRVAGEVCPCCKTSLAVGEDGRVYVGWRQVLPGNFRHIAVAFSGDGGQTFSPAAVVSDDRWELQGCPVSGPALAAGDGGSLRVLWYTAGEAGRPGLYWSESRDGGRTFSPRRVLADAGGRGTPALLKGVGGGLTAVWEGAEGVNLAPVRVRPDGDSRVTAPAVVAGGGELPAAAEVNGRVFVACGMRTGDVRGVWVLKAAGDGSTGANGSAPQAPPAEHGHEH